MISKHATKPTRDESARFLAKFHARWDPGIHRIFRLEEPGEDKDSTPIKLLEVNRDGVPAGVMPIYFGPSEQVPYTHIIVELTPKEFRALQKNELQLPPDWGLGEVLYRKRPKRKSNEDPH